MTDGSKVVDVRSICVTLGPYRNLSTLTAAIVALHPQCQVLNHAYDRISDRFQQAATTRSPALFDALIQDMIELSQGGRRGDYGGTIVHSHAFDHDVVRELYRSRYGSTLVKPAIRCVYWKESLRVTNFLRQSEIDIRALLAAEPRLRFIMPIRNPLDCAISNARTGHFKLFGEETADLPRILDRVLDCLAWFADLQAQHPDRFFCYPQDEFGARLLSDLACFLSVDDDPQWIEDALLCYRLKPSYAPPEALLRRYDEVAGVRLACHPTLRAALDRMVHAR